MLNIIQITSAVANLIFGRWRNWWCWRAVLFCSWEINGRIFVSFRLQSAVFIVALLTRF